MVSKTSEKALLDLEHSDLPALDLFDHVADILDIKLEKLTNTFLTDPDDRPSTLTFAPREEWVLRWLLKKLDQRPSTRETEDKDDPALQFLLDPKTWTLFLYLVHVIPYKNLARILVDRDFLSKAVDYVHDILRLEPIHGQLPSSVRAHASLPDPESQQARKKRRLSPPEDGDGAYDIDRHYLRIPEVSFLVCQAINICSKSAETGDVVSGEEPYRASLTWTMSPSTTAQIVSKLLEMALVSLCHYKCDWQYENLLRSVRGTVNLWNANASVENAISRSERDALFQSHCLRPILALLWLLESHGFRRDHFGRTKRFLERPISLHTVLPLRVLLNTNIATGLSLDNTALSRSEVEPLCKIVRGSLGALVESRFCSNCNEQAYQMETLAPVLLNIAFRTIPRTDLRRKQREQPWLDALFLGLSYMVYPAFPMMENQSDGLLGQVTSQIEQTEIDAQGGQAGLGYLLEVLSENHFTLSLPVLSYLTSAIVVSRIRYSAWKALVHILGMDANVLVPNSGLKNARSCLERVWDNISEADFGEKGLYDLVLESVIVPLMWGFAKARDLGGFVGMWRRGLEASISNQVLASPQSSGMHEGAIFDDEDLFVEFAKIVRVYATPTFAGDLCIEAHQLLLGIVDRTGPTADIFALLAMLDTLFTARPEDFRPDSCSALVTDAILALTHRSNYQLQRWRLWKLLRHVLPLISDYRLPEECFHSTDSTLRYVSLASARDIKGIQSKTVRRSNWREMIECFHLLVSQALRQEAGQTILELLRTEIGNLFILVARVSDEVAGVISNIPLWDGRMRTMNDEFDVVTACIGILLQRPSTFLVDPQSTHDWVSKMCNYGEKMSGIAVNQRMSTLIYGLAQAVVSAEALSANKHAYQQSFKALLGSTAAAKDIPWDMISLLHSIEFPAVGRRDLKILAEMLVERLKNASHPRSEADLTAAAALLQEIMDACSVSVGKPQNWRQLVELAERIAQQSGNSPQSHSIIHGMVDTLWKRSLQLEETAKTKQLFQDMLSWCAKRVDCMRPAGADDYSFPITKGLISHFWNCRDNARLMGSRLDIEQVRGRFFTSLVADLGALSDMDRDLDRSPTRLRIIVQGLSSCADLCKPNESLQKLFPSVNMAIEQWKTKARGRGGDTDHEDTALLESAQGRLRHLVIGADGLSLKGGMLDKLLMDFARSAICQAPPGTMEAMMKREKKVVELLQTIPPNGNAAILEILHKNAHPELKLVRSEILGVITYQTKPGQLQEMPLLAQQLSYFASLQFALDTDSPQQLCMDLESCRYILDRHPAVASQWTIDNLLNAVAVLSSSAVDVQLDQGSNLVAEIGTSVFDRLCGLVSLVLGRFRRRLQGRYHLLLPAMQNLLRCLFYAGRQAFEAKSSHTPQQVHFVESLPAWLRNESSSLPPLVASTYARLLSSICDPTTSSVRSSRNKSRTAAELTDETKKAKRIAGQYMQYLIMDYAKCSLDGQISPDVKAKLMPGLYAVLDVMPRELMRAMNAAMDASSRAIFKGLYDDWLRFGRWDKN